MPIYEYRCTSCRKMTTAMVLVRSREGDVRCAHCGGSDLTKLVSRFATPRSEEARLDRLSDPASFARVDENDPKSVAQWMKKMGGEMGENVGEDFGQAIEKEMAAADDGPTDPGDNL